MKIQINNLSDNMTVPHSLLLLRGKIVNSGCQIVESINVYKKTSPIVKRTNWPVYKRQFVAYVQLDKGCNILVLKTNTQDISQLQLRVNYRTPDIIPYVLPVYIVCRDDTGKFQTPTDTDNSIQSACERIELAAQMLQVFVAESLKDDGFGPKTFRLAESEECGREMFGLCSVFRSSLTRAQAHQLKDKELWTHFACELMNCPDYLDKNNCKFFAFMSFTEYVNDSMQIPNNFNDVLKMTKGHTALGGGGLALFGTGCLHTWPTKIEDIIPRFTDDRSIDKMQFMDDSANRGSYWACYSTGLGATLHELGHTFDLGHNPSGIMARGFDDMNKFFTLSEMIGCGDSKSDDLSNSNILANNQEKNVSVNKSLQQLSNQSDFVCNLKTTMTFKPSNEENIIKLTKSWPRPDNAVDSYGGAFWHRSSAVILANHKWLNERTQIEDLKDGPRLSGLNVTASNDLCVIEVRDIEGNCVHFWDFTSQKTFQFKINPRKIPGFVENNVASEFIVVAEDCKGNILNTKIS